MSCSPSRLLPRQILSFIRTNFAYQNDRRFYSIPVLKLIHAMVSGITSYLNKCLFDNKWLRPWIAVKRNKFEQSICSKSSPYTLIWAQISRTSNRIKTTVDRLSKVWDENERVSPCLWNDAVTLSQMTEIANKIVEMDNLLSQTIKSRLIIHDYDKGDFSNQSAVNKSLVNSKAFGITGN